MSFYDLSKDGVLRPKELFKYRLKRDGTIPSRGGQKDFEPDGSWMQSKQLEAFLQDRLNILSEARVEKLKNVAEGVWDEERRLVNLKKPGKFWMHMGFTDERRNWLYPEEALFLMETNTLELYFKERPMSIQEAYSKLLGRGMCLEEYQVFSHLRRLGYVVLRHEEERIFTDYERKINLHEYIDKKKRKEKLKKGKGKSNKKISQDSTEDNLKTDMELDSHNTNNNTPATISQPETSEETTGQKSSVENMTGDNDQMNDITVSKRIYEESEDIETKKLKLANDKDDRFSTDSDLIESISDSDGSFYNISSWSPCFLKDANKAESRHSESYNENHLESSLHNLFPDIGQRDSSCLKSPPSHLLPSNLEISESEFNAFMDNLKNPGFCKFSKASEYFVKEKSQDKQFSYLERTDKQPKIEAKSWSEYKRQKAERLAEMSASSLVDYLWSDDTVTPLMHPARITSFQEVMNRLNIIQAADNDSLVPDDTVLSTLPKVSFDVHLPDHRFKKSMPGIPDHRVCVTRCDGIPPGLAAVQHFTRKYKDKVPIHWAVVDSGEIAFYAFDNSKPLDVLNLC